MVKSALHCASIDAAFAVKMNADLLLEKAMTNSLDIRKC
jgi:hypothetical protein